MTGKYDVVVVGSGTNTLGCAGYLAKAGKKVLVLEKNSIVGGGAVTDECTLPGFKHDLHSNVHMFIQANPLLTNDELGLLSKFGLKYNYPNVSQRTVLEDFRSIDSVQDIDKTCESIAIHSKKDAEAYGNFARWSVRMLPLMMAGMFTLPVRLSGLFGMFEQSEDGRKLIDLMLRSPLQIVNSLFESDIVKLHILKLTTEASYHFSDEMGTGLAVLLLPAFLHSYRMGAPVGGSGQFTQALRRCVEHYGGEVITDCEVDKILMSGGRAIGVRTKNSGEYIAKDAVIASIHPLELERYVDGIPKEVTERSKRVVPSSYACIKIDGALDRPIASHPKIPGEKIPGVMREHIFANTLREYMESFDPLRHGRISYERPLFTAGAHSMPDRCPPGKAILWALAYVPFELADGGTSRWAEIKEEVADRMLERFQHFMPDLTADRFLARKVDSPVDMQTYSPSFQRGDTHGLGSQLFHTAGYRPTIDLAQYAVPGADRLYLCGPFMHPSGGVFAAGRPTAIKVCEDLGIDFDKLVGGRS